MGTNNGCQPFLKIMPRILILTYSNINRDPRVLKQISFFRNQGFEIVLSSLEYQGNLTFFPIRKQKKLVFRALKLVTMIFRLKKLRVWEFVRNSSFEELKNQSRFDLIFANDEETWPIAEKLQKLNPNTKLVIDAHEYYPGQFNDQISWSLFHKWYSDYLCETYPKTADCFITVCDGLARAYEKKYVKKALVILNTPDFESDLNPVPVGEKIKLIHHGIAVRSRKIEKMIQMMDVLDSRFEMNLMLMPTDLSYYKELQIQAKGKSVNFLPPVPTKEISSFLNQFDIGLFLLEPVNFNYEFALPNKFFEFIQARLAIAIGPSPEMKKILEKERLGVVSDNFDGLDLAKRLNQLSNNDIFLFKQRCHEVAFQYSSHQNEEVFASILDVIGFHPQFEKKLAT